MARLIIGIVAIALSACATKDDVSTFAPSPSNLFFLSSSEISELSERAYRGDVEAMRALYLHYSVATGEDHLAVDWAERAGDAGDDESRVDAICDAARIGESERVEEMIGRWQVADFPSCVLPPNYSLKRTDQSLRD